MRDLTYINEYYNLYDEDSRLTSKHGSVEFLTTMKYLHDNLKPGMKLLEVGAGTGRYSLALAKEGYTVEAVELVQHNVDVLKSKIQPQYDLQCIQGDALDLSNYADNIFDVVLVLGPMYHLYTRENQHRCLEEAIRVTKTDGKIFVAYCMNEATILQYGFKRNKIKLCLDAEMLTKDYHCISVEKDLFQLFRTEEIDELNALFDVKLLKRVAADGPAYYLTDIIDEMDEETFQIFLIIILKFASVRI